MFICHFLKNKNNYQNEYVTVISSNVDFFSDNSNEKLYFLNYKLLQHVVHLIFNKFTNIIVCDNQKCFRQCLMTVSNETRTGYFEKDTNNILSSQNIVETVQTIQFGNTRDTRMDLAVEEVCKDNNMELEQEKSDVFSFNHVSDTAVNNTPVKDILYKNLNGHEINDDSDNEDINVAPKNKSILQSTKNVLDSESDCSDIEKGIQKIETNNMNLEKGGNENNVNEPKKSSGINGLIDSDTDEDVNYKESTTKTVKRRIFSNEFDSSEDDEGNDNIKSRKQTGISNSPKCDKKLHKIDNLIDSESDDDAHIVKSGKLNSVSTNICDNHDDYDDQEHDSTKKKKDRKLSKSGMEDRAQYSRNSKSSAMEQIRSETQRLVREMKLSIPYHIPKQRTLQEFLNRKKTKSIVPEAPTIAAKIKMFPDIVSKVVEEKEKDVEEFFDSSDSDVEQSSLNTKPNYNIASHPMESNMDISNENSTENVKENISTTQNLVSENVTPAELNSCDMNDSLKDTFKLDSNIKMTADHIDSASRADHHQIHATDKYKKVNSQDSQDESVKTQNDEMNIDSMNLHLDSVKENIVESDKNVVNSNINRINVECESISKSEETAPKKTCTIKDKILKACANIKPMLHAKPGTMIDLSEDLQITNKGVNKLLDRFARHNVKTHKTVQPKPNSIISLVDEEDELPHLQKPGAKLVKFKNELKQQIDSKRNEMWKRMEEEEGTSHKKEMEHSLNDDEDAEVESVLSLEVEDDDAEDNESDLEDDYLPTKERKRKKCIFGDDEAEVSGDDENSEIDDEEDDEEDTENEEDVEKNDEEECKSNGKDEVGKKSRKLKRIVKAFEEDEDSNLSEVKNTEENNSNHNIRKLKTDEDMFDVDYSSNEEIPVFQQPLSSNEFSTPLSVPESQLKTVKETMSSLESSPCFSSKSSVNKKSTNLRQWLGMQSKLFDNKSPNDTVNEDDLLDICSGNFTDNISDNTGLSQLIDKSSTKENTESQLMAICSGEFVSQSQNETSVDKRHAAFNDDAFHGMKLILEKELRSPAKTTNSKNKESEQTMFSSSEDEDDDFLKYIKQKKAKLSSAAKPLVASDDDDNSDKSDISEEEVLNEELDDEEKYVEYDSEENEVVVIPKKDIKKVAQTFVENEAELSESDWDSADEDEKDLDMLEMEEGDQEDIDEDEVRNQLGKIHAKQVLDEDQREIKLYKEFFFEDGDLHTDGPGRERKFKWKNIDKLDLNEFNKPIEDDDFEPMHVIEELNDMDLMKLRNEQQEFLKKHKKEVTDNIEEDFNDSQFFKIGLQIATKQKNSEIENENVANEKTKSNTFSSSIFALSSIGNKSASVHNTVRGSFLSRGKEELARIAMRINDSDNVVLNPMNSKKFVFEHISPSVNNENSEQRKVDEDEENAKRRKRKSGLDGTPISTKKQKTNNHLNSKKLFLDHNT